MLKLKKILGGLLISDFIKCLVPYSYGIIYKHLMEVNLWDIYCMLML